VPLIEAEIDAAESSLAGQTVPDVGEDADALVVAAEAPLAAPDIQVEARCDLQPGNVDVAVVGDRLALRFFEHSALASAPSPDGSLRSDNVIFERLDLSGSYEVAANGAVSLPAIGHVDVIGRSLSCVEALVTLAASERLRLSGSVSAAYASRPPVLVQGKVRAPGAHVYSPGLTVERVLAQAGAMQEAEPLSALQQASLRANEQELEALAASLTIEQARIDAAMASDLDLAADSEAWEALSEMLGADRVESERSALLSELAEEKAQQDRTADRVDTLVNRVSAAQEHFRVAETQLAYVLERHETLAAQLEQGITTYKDVEVLMLRVMEMERTVLERRDALLQLEADLRLARHESGLREAERQNRLALAALDAVKERASVREQLHTVRAQLAVQSGEAARTFDVTIQRPELDGIEHFAASLETMVLPGDLVTVASADESGAPAETPVREIEAGQSDDPAVLVSWR
jgi:protein involved in polysaccharide export with SLBB domain